MNVSGFKVVGNSYVEFCTPRRTEIESKKKNRVLSKK
jgi:hypothetical protein